MQWNGIQKTFLLSYYTVIHPNQRKLKILWSSLESLEMKTKPESNFQLNCRSLHMHSDSDC